jgi:hypothetical protein
VREEREKERKKGKRERERNTTVADNLTYIERCRPSFDISQIYQITRAFDEVKSAKCAKFDCDWFK